MMNLAFAETTVYYDIKETFMGQLLSLIARYNT